MKTRNSFVRMIAGLVAVLVIVMWMGPAVAVTNEDEDAWYENFDGDAETPDQTVSVYNPPHREHDPFFPMVHRWMKQEKPTPPIDEPGIKPPVSPPVIQEIKLDILCIVGNSVHRLALIEQSGVVREMAPGDEVAGQFKIMGIDEDSVEVYSHQTRRRASFSLGRQ